ncbi:hypothetical protein [Verrucosispora sp. WMMD1129]|uniref:hypothetical protein n=1 Tax=Verrucosispora sp. WMMD1129 TaxID=3016093 RepID=UPI00249C6ED3|nr:hypothetical protein [Verrucosispora sp. WMMD1129]WFE47692.1 hypothetical protein O7624_26865 [Verrucosispora sp. WMMD1129]
MADLDIFVDVIVSGAVVGVGLIDSPDGVAHAIGTDFVEDCGHAVMRRDYGLVEFFWARRSGSDPWHATGFTVQVHRLASLDVTGSLIRRYGPFGRHLGFARLNAELERLGYRLDEITQASDAGFRRYWLAESRVSLVVAPTPGGEVTDVGDVWSISGRQPPEAVAAAGLGAQRQAITDGLAHLLRLGDNQRRDWLDRRQPATSARVNWWLYLLLVIDQLLGDQPRRRADWVELKLWLLRQGQARGVLTRAESAEKVAYFAADMRRAGAELPDLLPSADDIVRACLDAIPVGRDQVPMLGARRDLHRLDRTQMRLSRLARNLVNAAQWHLDEVQDERLADQLREWIAVKPSLVYKPASPRGQHHPCLGPTHAHRHERACRRRSSVTRCDARSAADQCAAA